MSNFFLEGFLQHFGPFKYSSPPTPDCPSFTYVSSPAPAALCGAEIEGALTSVHVSTAQRTTVLSLLHT